MNKGHLSFLIGLPRSGKSTYANNWLLRGLGSERPRVIVSGDDIRKALTGERYNSYSEEFIFPIEHLFIKCQLARGCDVLADDTHTTWASIRALLKLDPDATPIWYPHSIASADKKEYKYFFNLPYSADFRDHIKVCHDRARQTNQSDLIPVINRMAKSLESLADGFWEKLEAERAAARNFQPSITPA